MEDQLSSSPFIVNWKHASKGCRMNASLFKDIKSIERDGEYVPREVDGIRASFRVKLAEDLYFRTKFDQGKFSSIKLAIHHVGKCDQNNLLQFQIAKSIALQPEKRSDSTSFAVKVDVLGSSSKVGQAHQGQNKLHEYDLIETGHHVLHSHLQ